MHVKTADMCNSAIIEIEIIQKKVFEAYYMIDLSPWQPWLGPILTDTMALYCQCCERGCVAASNQLVYIFDGCVSGYVHAWK